MKNRIPIITIVGRPNVGKSTLFNRIIGKNIAIVEDMPGVTRDRNYALVDKFEVPFYLVDTGGFDTGSNDELSNLTKDQTILSVEESDGIIFMVDSKHGLNPDDHEVLKILRSHKKPFILLANKCDGKELEDQTTEFYSLGVDEVLACSALHGHGINSTINNILTLIPNYELLKKEILEKKQKEEEIFEQLEEDNENLSAFDEDDYDQNEIEAENKVKAKTVIEGLEHDFAPVFDPDSGENPDEYEDLFSLLPLTQNNTDHYQETIKEEEDQNIKPPDLIRVAIIGRPNVGKSSILNKLIGENRSIISATAGTTRDTIHEQLTHNGQTYELIDTAGMRKKGRIGDSVEKYSVLRSMRAISECDVAVVVLDAEQGPSEQDAKILGIAHEEGKGIVIVVNKWDLIEKNHKSVKEFEQKIKDEFKFVPYAPMCFTSAKTGKRIHKILNHVLEVGTSRQKRIPTMVLNNILKKELPRTSSPTYRGRAIKLYYASQVDVAPPRFLLVFNYPSKVHFSYLRFIKNIIREQYKYIGTDIKLITRKRGISKKRSGAKQ